MKHETFNCCKIQNKKKINIHCYDKIQLNFAKSSQQSSRLTYSFEKKLNENAKCKGAKCQKGTMTSFP